MWMSRMETDGYRITHYRITERNILAPETRIVFPSVKFMLCSIRATGMIMNQGLRQTITLGLAEISVILHSKSVLSLIALFNLAIRAPIQ